MKRLTKRCSNGIADAGLSPFWEIVDRLAVIEDILGNYYDLDYLRNLTHQCMTMREDVAERMKIAGDIPLDRLRELVEEDKKRMARKIACKNCDVGWATSCGSGKNESCSDTCDKYMAALKGEKND